MLDFLKDTYNRLIDRVDVSFKRYPYATFKPGRMTGLVGPRGVGKTTMLLQYIKENLYQDGKTFYFSADAVYFQQNNLLGFVNDLYSKEGYRIFFIDEVHKYSNWSQELKNIYDSFPDVQVVFSGSSMLDILQGSHDLSRRAVVHRLEGFSFREYINFVGQGDTHSIEFDTLIRQPTGYGQLSMIERVQGLYQDYLSHGYYPFVFEDSLTYYKRILNIVEKTIYEDIANYYKLSTSNLPVFKKILSYLASIPPGEVNTNNIAKNLKMSHQTIFHYLTILDASGLIRLIYINEGGNVFLRKPEKILIHNTNLLYALNELMGRAIDQGALREIFFTQALSDAGMDCHYVRSGDYSVKDVTFEIGGKNKKRKQISKTTGKAFVVKDDILVPSPQTIPLFYFGFLY